MDGFTGWGRMRNLGRGAVLALCLVLTTLLTGCTRKFYRNQADREVGTVLAEKDQYDFWKIENYHVYPDPRARFADPTNPDRPPMPPDDPAANQSAPRPQRPGKAGIELVEGTGYLDLLSQWNAENRSAAAAGPDQFAVRQVAAAPQAEGQSYLIKLEQAVELGLINSREYQDRREDLYLTALPVTLQRFSFTAQFLATEEAIRERTGRLTPEGEHNRWRLNGTAGFTKLFSTGALLLFRFANQTVIDLTGNFPRDTVSTSTALLELTQPLLQGGGRAVTLEPLTQVERNLLYEIRDYAHFRKQFFVFLAGGVDITRGGAIGQALAASGQAPGEGYLPTVLRTAQIANERKNVAAFEDFLRRFKAFFQGGEVGQVNVDQIEQQLLSARFTVSQRETDYRDGLDRLKLQLGVPVNLPLELDDEPLDPMTRHIQRFEEVFNQYKNVKEAAENLDKAGVRGREVRARLRDLAANSPLTRGTKFSAQLKQRWEFWEKMTSEERKARLAALLAEREKVRDEMATLQVQRKEIPESLERRRLMVQSQIDFGEFMTKLAEYEATDWQKEPDPAQRQRQHSIALGAVVSRFVTAMGDARTERLERVQATWTVLPSLCVNDVDLLRADLEEAQAVVAQTALINRLDLMNQRALLADAWRKIAVFANSLLGAFNIQYHLDSATPPGQAKPLAFQGSRSRHQLILDAELPLVRQNERNNYRASLIAYQRSRRALMQAEDAVVASVRQQVRQLRLLAENYRIQQRQVELAYAQVEQSLESFSQPSTPPAGQVVGPPGGGGGGAGNAAALTTQLISAQQSLNRAQNQLYGVWINYLIARMQLYRDLELMPLDFRGVWNDEHTTCRGPDRPGSGDRPADAGPGGQREAGGAERLPEPREQPPASPYHPR